MDANTIKNIIEIITTNNTNHERITTANDFPLDISWNFSIPLELKITIWIREIIKIRLLIIAPGCFKKLRKASLTTVESKETCNT